MRHYVPASPGQLHRIVPANVAGSLELLGSMVLAMQGTI